jgi:hypothetical protein
VSDARTPADIEADIVRRRQELAAALDEIAVRVHPRTLVGDAKAKVAERVDHTVGRVVEGARSTVVREDGGLRLERVVPAVALAVLVVGGLCALSVRRRRY